MAPGRRNDPNEFAETPNASVRSNDPQAASTERADDPSALADPPVGDEQDPRVTGRASGRDQRAATSTAATPAPEPGDEEQVADPDAAEQVDMEVRCPQWRRLTVPGDNQGDALTITEEWQRVSATDLARVRRAARSAAFDIRAREVPAGS